MKKTLTLCLALMMVLALSACGEKAGNDLPTLKKRLEAMKSGEVSYEEAEKQGWMDKEMTAWLDENATTAAGTGGDGGGAVTGNMIPSKLPVQEEYIYDYMGLSYVLPEELRNMLKGGEAWMHNAVEMNGETDFNYSSMFFLLAEKDNLGKDFESYEAYEAWEKTTKRFGAITVIRSDFLKNGEVEQITKCEANTEIGKSSDGKYIFYLSTNQVDNISDLFKTTKVSVSDPKKIPSPKDDPAFGIMNSTRVELSDLGDFKAQNVEGTAVDSSIFLGYDLTMVNLWTTTCGYCIEEMPDLESIRSEMQKKGISFNIVGMCLDVNQEGEIDSKKIDKVREIIKETGIQYDTIIPDTVLWKGRLKGVNAFPETFFVDKNGNIVGDTVLGSNSKERWQEIIDKELANLGK